MKRIYVALNTEPDKIRIKFTKAGMNFIVVPQVDTVVIRPKTMYGFTSIESLLQYLPHLTKPPILWESLPVVRQLSLICPIKFIDAKQTPEGLINFRRVKKIELLGYFRKRFNIGKLVLKYDRHKNMLTEKSSFNSLLNIYLSTIPYLAHEPFLVSLSHSLEVSDYHALEDFINKNRLVTDKNENSFNELMEYVGHIEPMVIKMLEGKVFDSSSEAKMSLRRIKLLLIMFGNKKIEDFMDSEDTINVIRKV